MIPVSVPEWHIYAGDDESRLFTFETEEGELVDISGWGTPRAQWRPKADAAQVVELPCSVDEGRVRLRIPGSASAVVGGTIRDGVFDLQFTSEVDGELQRRTVLAGDVVWHADITRE